MSKSKGEKLGIPFFNPHYQNLSKYHVKEQIINSKSTKNIERKSSILS